MARVFSQKHSSTSMGNDGIYSAGEDIVEQIGQNSKTDCFTDILQKGLTCEILAKTNCLHPALTLRIPIMCRAHISLCGMLTRELPAKTLQSSICLESSHSLSLTHTTLTNKSHHKYRIQKIEHNYNQI